MALFDLFLVLLALPALLSSIYLFTLACLAKEASSLPLPHPLPRFAVVIPAHNEQAGIARTVENLRTLNYPASQREVVVVADNCSDDTAAVARASGVRVLERHDLGNRGKGHALEYAFAELSRENFDACVVIDADTSASPNLLSAFAAKLGAGAEAIQAHYSVRNPHESWRTRLITLALALFHGVRSLARERLGLSVGLRGNGMCFSTELLRRVPHTAHSIVEDLEYGILLGLSGVRVHDAGDAKVFGDMVAGERDSRSQRQRWEAGRRSIAKQYGLLLLRQALKKRSALLFDLAVDVLLPPLASLALYMLFGSMMVTGWVLFFDRNLLLLAPWALAVGMLGLYVLSGVRHSGLGTKAALFTLLWAPLYVFWKLGIRLLGLGAPKARWVRTARKEAPALEKTP